jgi:hypothetical protein
MTPSEMADELAQPGAQELLRSATLARLAYQGRDGNPRVVPVGFWWNGSQVVVCTATVAPKVEALAANGQVALTIDTAEDVATALLLRGQATLETVDGIAEEYLAAARKSFADDQFAQFEARVRAMYPQMVRITVEPTWARFYDFGSGRIPEFLKQLAGEA